MGDSTTLAIRIEQYFQGLDSPGKLKLAMAGFPRNCSEAMVKDVGAVAIEGGHWEIYIGGAAGAHVRKGDLLCVVNGHDEVLQRIAIFIQYYRENAKYLERTYGFVERVGIAKIRAVVVRIARVLSSGIKLNTLASPGAQECTATIGATIGGIVRMIKISRIKNSRSPIGCRGDGGDNNPATSVVR